jgi:hypothetical protein
MSTPAVLSDQAFLAANHRTISLLRERHPSRSDGDLVRAVRICQWLTEPAEQLQEPELASYLLREMPAQSGKASSDPTIPSLW